MYYYFTLYHNRSRKAHYYVRKWEHYYKKGWIQKQYRPMGTLRTYWLPVLYSFKTSESNFSEYIILSLHKFIEYGCMNNLIYKAWCYLSLGICSYLRYWKQFVGRIENRYMHLQAYVLSGSVIYRCEVIAQNKTPWRN